ncbi:hypothetical protein HZS_5502 [Henneguya salminicola]|nr:hypothetical protein HZS_5502 [Henneguya salminicola]
MTRSLHQSEYYNFFYEEPGRERIYVWAKRRFIQNQSFLFNHARLYLPNKEWAVANRYLTLEILIVSKYMHALLILFKNGEPD